MYARKLAEMTSPHRNVTAIMKKYSAEPYAELLAAHQEGYTSLFPAALVDFGAKESTLTTGAQLKNYQAG